MATTTKKQGKRSNKIQKMTEDPRKTEGKSRKTKVEVTSTAKERLDSESDLLDVVSKRRSSRIKSCSVEELEAFVDQILKDYCGGKIPEVHKDAPHLNATLQEKFNAMFAWVHENIPFEFTHNRRLQEKMDKLGAVNMYMSERVDFNAHIEGLWLKKYYRGEFKKVKREQEREAAPPHPIIQFIMNKESKEATFAEIKEACPEINHLYSCLHYLINKKNLLIKDRDTGVYRLTDSNVDSGN